MKKLELKHLAGYLPYGLKCNTDIGNLYLTCITNYDTYKAWFHYKFNSKNKFVEYNLKNNTTTDNSSGKGFMLKEIKPILHPLSDLTKEIVVNGEKFVPIDEMESLGWFNMNCINKDKVLRIPFGMMQFLLKWHFDIHGLIPANLAIDINTLKSK